jgi:hypothetical protein
MLRHVKSRIVLDVYTVVRDLLPLLMVSFHISFSVSDFPHKCLSYFLHLNLDIPILLLSLSMFQ